MKIEKYTDRSIVPFFIRSGTLQSDLERVSRLTYAGITDIMLFQSSSRTKGSEESFTSSSPIDTAPTSGNSSLRLTMSGDLSAMTQTIAEIKKKHSDITLIADACVCSETLDGQCRLRSQGEGGSSFDIEATLDRISTLAVEMAGAGADIISLSAMIDGQTARIRHELDAKGHSSVKIMPVAKIVSSYYQVALGIINPNTKNITPGSGIPKSSSEMQKPYHLQIDEAEKIIEWSLREAAKSADILMVKPGLSSLDIIYRLKSLLEIPIYAYVTTGKYQIMKAGMQSLGFNKKDISRFFQEEMDSLFRAGAEKVITGMIEDLIDEE